jgi:hypothetical protein
VCGNRVVLVVLAGVSLALTCVAESCTVMHPMQDIPIGLEYCNAPSWLWDQPAVDCIGGSKRHSCTCNTTVSVVQFVVFRSEDTAVSMVHVVTVVMVQVVFSCSC